MKFTTAATLFIGLLGSLQMAGHALGSRTLRGLGLATGIAPYPKVFCEAEGYEPFAATFTITGNDEAGQEIAIPLTAERYSQLKGPYQRRNVFGAALAYAPRLPENLRDHLFSKVLAEGSPLSSELGLPLLVDPKILIKACEGEAIPNYQFQLR